MLSIVLMLAVAQAEEEEPGGARVETSTTTMLPAGACPHEADQFYTQGFDDLTHGDVEDAYNAFTRVLEICPSHPFAAEMARLAVASPPRKGPKVAAKPDQKATVQADDPWGPEKPSLLARGELVTFQSLHGLGDGLAFCAAVSCDDARALVGLGFVGTAALGGLSLGLSSQIRSGQALAINAGTGWGLWHAIEINSLLDPREGSTVAGVTLLANLIGTGAGVVVATQLVPRNGQVSFANSSGIWAGVLALFVLDAAGIDPGDGSGFWATELIVTDVGLALGAIASTQLEISRGRTLLIDAGGLGGLLLGIGVAVLAENEPSQELVGTLGLIGTMAGLGSVFYLSRNIDAQDAAPTVMLIPGGPKGSYGGTLAVAF